MGLNPGNQVESGEVRPGREEKSILIKLVTGVSNQNLIPQGELWEMDTYLRGKGARVFRGIYTPNPVSYYGGEWC